MDILNQAASKSNHSKNSHERSILKKLNQENFEDKFFLFVIIVVLLAIYGYCFNLSKVQKNVGEKNQKGRERFYKNKLMS